MTDQAVKILGLIAIVLVPIGMVIAMTVHPLGGWALSMLGSVGIAWLALRAVWKSRESDKA